METYQIREKFNFKTPSGFKSYCHRNNIRMNELRGKVLLKKIINEDIQYDHELFGYFCGWMASDGTMDRGRPRMRIQLQYADKSILIKLGKVLILNFQEEMIYVSKKSNGFKYVALHIENKNLYEVVYSRGITCAKTKTMELKIPKNEENSFLRGYLDGDGSVTFRKYIPKSGKRLGSIRYIGNENTMKMIHEIFKCHGLTSYCHRVGIEKYTFPFYQVSIHKKSSIRILYNILYKNNKIKLDRKHDKMFQLLN